MAHIDCLVDTNPMAREIESVSRSVNTTTTAVVAMRAAVVSAEKEAADHVCQNVNRGFYTLIRSQISQKIAKLQSEVDSHLMQLNQQRKQLLAIKNRMERDYNMIAARYSKLFTGLNLNLKQRVFELDKQTVNFAVKDINRISNRTKQLPATIPVVQTEALTASQKILASNVKYRGLNVVNSMSAFLEDMAAQKRLTDGIMLRDKTSMAETKIAIPVVICECNYDSVSTNTSLALPEENLDRQTRNMIKNQVNSSVDNMNWVPASESKEIDSEFTRHLNDSNLSARAKEMARKLYVSNNHLTVKK